MTFHRDQIQALIAEIDDVLGRNKKSRLGWLKFGDSAPERQVLEKVRSNLNKLQQQLTPATGYITGEIASVQALPLKSGDSPGAEWNQQKTPEQILQAVAQEMGYLRTFYERATHTHLRQQYQADLEVLYRQRQALIEEIKQLEEKRKNYASLPAAELQEKAPESTISGEKAEYPLENNLPIEELPVAANEETIPNRDEPIAQPEIPLLYAGVELPPEKIAMLERSQTTDSQVSELDETTAASSEIEDTSNIENSLAAESIDTIAALTELIGSAPPENTDQLENELAIANTTAEVDPSFLAASPDEDLLPSAEIANKSNIDIWLGKNILDRLSEDLSTLEGMIANEGQEQPDILHTKANTEPTSSLISTSELPQSRSSQAQEYNPSEEIEPSEALEPAVGRERESIPCNIPEDILAEFDDLFGESLEKINKTDIWDAHPDFTRNSHQNPEIEKKN